jgi:hypothetical protein
VKGPSTIRDGYGFSWNSRNEATLRRWAALARRLLPTDAIHCSLLAYGASRGPDGESIELSDLHLRGCRMPAHSPPFRAASMIRVTRTQDAEMQSYRSMSNDFYGIWLVAPCRIISDPFRAAIGDMPATWLIARSAAGEKNARVRKC